MATALPDTVAAPLEKFASLTKQLDAARVNAINALNDAKKQKEAELASIEAELSALGSTKSAKKTVIRNCKKCGQPGHNARSCPGMN